MLMVVWSGELERKGKCPGLSNFLGLSQAWACMEFLGMGLARPLDKRWGHRKPLTGEQREVVRRLHLELGWGLQRIAMYCRVTEWQVKGALGADRRRLERRSAADRGEGGVA